ncbi:MAG: endonuclease/exonuclease/phosphatase family protein, partial [Chloroflexota bacterium]|nr:endonuclease/exonuclease/phosphatase family protein [Chloroflexota bacterium]
MANRTQLISMVTWNINGVRKKFKLIKIFGIMNSVFQSPDIICLQEVHSDEFFAKKIRQKFNKYNIFFSHGETNSRGVALLVKKTLLFDIKQKIIDTEGRYVILRGLLGGTFVSFASVYAPSEN